MSQGVLRGILVILFMLLLPLSGCQTIGSTETVQTTSAPVQTTPPGSTAATTESTTTTATPPQTTTSVTTSETTAQTSATTTSAPQFVCDPQGKIESVTVSTPEEWNSFAAAFNAEPERFADSVDVEIAKLLSFDGMIFVSLDTDFSGTIHGPKNDDVFSAESLRRWLDDCRTYPELGIPFCREFVAGFSNVRTVSGGPMFGKACGALSLEYLGFYNIAYQVIDPPQYGSFHGMLCHRAKSLSLENVIFLACGNAGEAYNDSHLLLPEVCDELLAETIQTLSLRNVIAQSCTANSAGLFYEVVEETLTVDGLYVVGCTNRTGIAYEYIPASLLGGRVTGSAALENIVLLRSRANGLIGSAFGLIAQVEALRNIEIATCNFYSPVFVADLLSGASGMLFPCYVGIGSMQIWPDKMELDFEAETLKHTPLIENVTVSGTVTSLNPRYGRDYDWYRALGITIENCLNIVD